MQNMAIKKLMLHISSLLIPPALICACLAIMLFSACSRKSSPGRRAPINGWHLKLKRDNPGSYHVPASKKTPF